MQRSEQIDALAKALSVAQSQIQPPKRTETANVGSYKYSYAELSGVWDAIRKPLSDNGLSVIQTPEVDGHEVTVRTMLAHESGQWIESFLTLHSAKPDAQAIGSAITYARRYSLMAMVGVAPEDDDGAAAMPQNAREATKLAQRTGWLGGVDRVAKKMAEAVDAGYCATVADYVAEIKTLDDLQGYWESAVKKPNEAGELTHATYTECNRIVKVRRNQLEADETLSEDALETAAAASEEKF